MNGGAPVCVFSLHPTRDVILDVPGLSLGEVNRARRWFSYPAGKALNVARTVGLLGGRARAVLFAPLNWSGFLRDFLGRYGVSFHHISIEGEGRVCVMLGEGKRETVVNTDLLMRPSPARIKELFREAWKAARAGGFTVVSGSLPPTMGDSRFRELLRVAGGAAARLVLDLSGARLRSGIRHKPWLIKPNLREFHALLGRKPAGLSALAAAARDLRDSGVARVLLSLGGAGCLLTSAEGDWFASPVSARFPVMSPIGCGDALLGGFLRVVAAGGAEADALGWGVAAATANLAHPGACLMPAAEVRALVPRVRIRRMK